MVCKEWKMEIFKGTPKRVYIFVNQDFSLLDYFAKSCTSLFSGIMKKIDSLNDLWLKEKALFDESLMEKEVFIYKPNNDKDVDLEKLKQFNNENSYRMIIIFLKDIDKRSKLYKSYQNNFVFFHDVGIADLTSHFELKYPDLIEKHIIWLIQNCYSTFANLETTVHFLDITAKATYETVNTTFINLRKNGFFHVVNDNTFQQFIMSTITGMKKQAIRIYNEKIKNEKVPFQCLSSLFYLYRNAWLFSECKTTDPIQTTGLTKWDYENYLKIQPYLSTPIVEKLINNIDLIISLMEMIKSGNINGEQAIEYFILFS